MGLEREIKENFNRRSSISHSKILVLLIRKFVHLCWRVHTYLWLCSLTFPTSMKNFYIKNLRNLFFRPWQHTHTHTQRHNIFRSSQKVAVRWTGIRALIWQRFIRPGNGNHDYKAPWRQHWGMWTLSKSNWRSVGSNSFISRNTSIDYIMIMNWTRTALNNGNKNKVCTRNLEGKWYISELQ